MYGMTIWRLTKSGRTHRGPHPNVWLRPTWRPMSPIMLCGLVVPADDTVPQTDSGVRSSCELCERNARFFH